jgi:hypothetical protein
MERPPLTRPSRLVKIGYALLHVSPLRRLLCALRWRLLKHRLTIMPGMDEAVGEDTLSHNLSAFGSGAVFGMAKRMSLLLYPTAALLKDALPTARVLIVGPRTEDDIFWAKSLGLYNTDGMDLLSYSKYIQIGDIHNSGLGDNSYDAVLLGWMISYTKNPDRVIAECKRIIRSGGYLGIGLESDATQNIRGILPPRMNTLNSVDDLAIAVSEPLMFNNRPYQNITHDCAAIFKVMKPEPDGAQ